MVHSIIRQKEEVVSKLQELFATLYISKKIKIYLIGDGATWVKDSLERLHYNTEFLLDFYHASGYISRVSKLRFYIRDKQGSKAGKKYRKILKEKGGKVALSKIKTLITKIQKSDLKKSDKKSDIEIINDIISYMESRVDQMNYKKAKLEGRPIGSGFIESACRFIVKQRLCLSGARFSLEDAERIMQLRCIMMMGLWDKMTAVMYKNRFKIKHTQPSSSYSPIILKKPKAA